MEFRDARRMMPLLLLPRLAGTRGATSEARKKKETDGGKRIVGRGERGRVAGKRRVASEEYLLPSSPPLTHRFTA